jgi:glycosyltransferase involved in cell wall biosynthesis
VKIRTFHTLRILSRAFEVTALCFPKRKASREDHDVEDDLAVLREFARVEAFPIPQDWSSARYAWDHLRSLASGRVYTNYVYDSAQFRRRLQDLLATEQFALVHVDSSDLCGYLPLPDGVPTVCVHHNVESSLLRRRAEAQESWWRRAYVRHQAQLMEREERRSCGDVALNVVVSAEDGAALGALVPEARISVVPNGVDVDGLRPELGANDGLVFVGGNTWWPNRDALEYFSESILPVIRSSGLQPSVRWVGRATEGDQQTYRREHDIELTGYVDDVRPFVRDAACYVTPLRVGGGTRLKILEAWAMGKAVVSTSIGCEGLEAVDGENILIGDSPESFGEAVISVLRDPALRDRLGRNGRSTAERRYGWDIIGESMVQDYRNLLD